MEQDDGKESGQGVDVLGSPSVGKGFLQGWAQAEIRKAELPGGKETFGSSKAAQEEPGRWVHIGDVQGGVWQEKQMCLIPFGSIVLYPARASMELQGRSRVEHLTAGDTPVTSSTA